MKKMSKKKITVIAIALLIAVCGIVIGSIAVIESSRLSKAYVSEYIQEYDAKGHIIDPNLFFANSNFIFDTDADAEMVFTDVGEYDWCITVSNNKFLIVKSKTVSVKYIIKDTTKPVFDENTPDEIEVYKDCEIENIEKIFKATDLAPVTIYIDKENIDVTTVGEYITNVYATDANGNVSNREIKVKVIEPSITLDKTSLNMIVGDSGTITATVKGKDQNVEWTSSDESIARVENGNITANKDGTVTIKAKANGVEATCEITIKEKVTTPINNGASSKNTHKPSNNGGSSRPSSNGNSSNRNNGGSSSSNNSSESSSQPTKPTWCWEGGSKHVIPEGIGWYSSYYQARDAVSVYAKNNGITSFHYEIQECDCGKFTAYVR